MGRFVDSVIALRILRILTTPFDQTDAYKLGIIDENGKELKRLSQLQQTNERDAYTILHRMIFRIKRIINKVPVENRKLSSYAAALSLIREHAYDDKEPIQLERNYLNKLNVDLTEDINFIEDYFNKKYTLTFKQFMEEAPANNAGGDGVAGFTPDTLGVPVNVQKKRRKMMRRDEVKFIGQAKKNLAKISK